MSEQINDNTFDLKTGILHHAEGIDLLPSNIELTGMEVKLVNVMCREYTMKSCLKEIKEK